MNIIPGFDLNFGSRHLNVVLCLARIS